MRNARRIIWLNETDSTNSEMRRRLQECGNLDIVSAVRQTAGRGQGGHKWQSEDGKNLTFSVLLEFGDRLDVHKAGTINTIITGALTEFLAGEGVRGVWVKAPNDIWVDDRKIAGILIENVLNGGYIARSIVGIGFDLNQTEWPEDLPNPVSLRQLTGRSYDCTAVLERLSELIEKNYLCETGKI